MNKMNKLTLTFCILALTHSVANAASTALVGNPEAGKEKVASVCSACHGADGNSVVPIWPSLAGQHVSYLSQQLHAFKSGARNNDGQQMAPMAAPLTEQEIADVSAYFSSQTPKIGTVSTEEVKSQGEKLYRGGNKASKVPACIACHAPNGRGSPQAMYPSLVGQQKDYLVKQLGDYKKGARGTEGPGAIMRDIALKMSEDEIKLIADYIAGLH